MTTGISIIVLTKDAPHLLDRLLSSFFKVNTHSPVEWIIIDHGDSSSSQLTNNNSQLTGTPQLTNNNSLLTRDVINNYISYAFIRHIKRDKNYSFAQSCNYGASKAKHPYLLFINNDIIYTSDVLPKAVDALEKDESIGAVGVRFDDESKSQMANKFAQISPMSISDSVSFFQSHGKRDTYNALLCRKDIYLSLDNPHFLANQAEQHAKANQWSESADALRRHFQIHGDSLPVKSLTKISSQLFTLDDFTVSGQVLHKAREKYPGNDHVLRLEKNQYYYHAYSSWLMETMAGEAEWYKADGLAERPDWETAVELCRRFVRRGVTGNAPGDLRQFVQSGLLLAEECRDKAEHNRANHVLDDVLHHLGGGLSDDQVRSVVQAISSVRTAGGDVLDAETEKITQLLGGISHEALDVHEWLCLNDILNWNGMLRCGMVARDAALKQARALGDASPGKADRQLTAARAALDQDDFSTADQYIARYKEKGNAHTASEITAYSRLLQGDVEGFRRALGYPVNEADRRFQEYIRGKSVAIVGPAPSEGAHGKEIDGFDVVIRFNYRGVEAQPDPEKYGTKTHVSLYNAHSFRHIVSTKGFDILNELDFCLIRRPRYDIDTLPIDKSRIRQIHEPNQAFYKSKNAVPAIVYDFLLQGAGSIKIFNSNFYLSKQHHSKQYSYRDENNLDAMPLRKLQPVMANHDLINQVNFINQLSKYYPIEIKNIDISAISLSNQKYLQQLEIYSFNINNRCFNGNGKLEYIHSSHKKKTKKTHYNYVIVSHHEKEKNIAVCATVFHLFLSSDPTHEKAFYFHASNSTQKEFSLLKNKLSTQPIVVFNGIYSLLKKWSLKCLNEAISNNCKIIIYWHESAWTLNICKKHMQFDEVIKKLADNKNLINHWATNAKVKQLVMYILEANSNTIDVVYESLPAKYMQNRKEDRHPNPSLIKFVGAGVIKNKRKGLDIFINISEDFNKKVNFECKFEWYCSEDTESVIKLYGDIGKVIFPGFVDNFQQTLTHYDIFLLTSRDDPAPLVALEALAADIPVFCYDTTGTAEFVPREFVASNYDEFIGNIYRYWENRHEYKLNFFRSIAFYFENKNFIKRHLESNLSDKYNGAPEIKNISDKTCPKPAIVSKSDPNWETKYNHHSLENEFIKSFRKRCYFENELDRPLLIIGSGQSNNYFDAQRVPRNPVIFRMGLFMLESNYYFGNHIDAYFGSIFRRRVHVALEIAIKHQFYTISRFFRNPNLMRYCLPLFREETARHVRLFQPKFWHWDLLMQYPELEKFIKRNVENKLPTKGLLALATGLILGFKNIYVTGIDLYKDLRSNNGLYDRDYFYELPDFVKSVTQKSKLLTGYKNIDHSEDVDLYFLKTLYTLFPAANIYSATHESPFSYYSQVAPKYHEHFIPNQNNLSKDIEKFKFLYKNQLYKHSGCLGEVRYEQDTIIGWGWNTYDSYSSPIIQVINDKNHIVHEINPDMYLPELDRNNIGQSNHGFTLTRNEFPAIFNNKTLIFKFHNGTELSGSPILLYGDGYNQNDNSKKILTKDEKHFCKIIRQHQNIHFDREWYIANNENDISNDIDVINHFVAIGVHAFKDPCPDININNYMLNYGLTNTKTINPLVHKIYNTYPTQYIKKKGRHADETQKNNDRLISKLSNQDLYDKALTAFKKNKFITSEIILKTLHNISTEMSVDAYIKYCRSARNLGKVKKADAIIKHALNIYPDSYFLILEYALNAVPPFPFSNLQDHLEYLDRISYFEKYPIDSLPFHIVYHIYNGYYKLLRENEYQNYLDILSNKSMSSKEKNKLKLLKLECKAKKIKTEFSLAIEFPSQKHKQLPVEEIELFYDTIKHNFVNYEPLNQHKLMQHAVNISYIINKEHDLLSYLFEYNLSNHETKHNHEVQQFKKCLNQNIINNINKINHKDEYHELCAMAIEIDCKVMSSQAWLCLYQLMLYRGMLECAYYVKSKAVSRTYLDANKKWKQPSLLIPAIRAALSNGDLYFADNYISYLDSIGSNIKDVNLFDDYLDFLSGRKNQLQGSTPPEHNSSWKYYEDLIRNKSIAIVGPAASSDTNGYEIDRHDIVIRFGYVGEHLDNPHIIGTKTDIAFYNSALLNMIEDRNNYEFAKSLSFMLFKDNRHNFTRNMISQSKARVVTRPDYYYFHKSANAIQTLIFDLLHFKPKSVKIFNVNFYLASTSYMQNYSLRETVNQDIRKSSMVHDLIENLNFVRNFQNAGYVQTDRICKNILNMNNIDYIKSMENIYFNENKYKE